MVEVEVISSHGEESALTEYLVRLCDEVELTDAGTGDLVDIVFNAVLVMNHPTYWSSDEMQEAVVIAREKVFEIDKFLGRSVGIESALARHKSKGKGVVVRVSLHPEFPSVSTTVFKTPEKCLWNLMRVVSDAVSCDDYEDIEVFECGLKVIGVEHTALHMRVSWPGCWATQAEGRYLNVWLHVEGVPSEMFEHLVVRRFN